MRYRVHYSFDDERRTTEVEARSLQEAAVKFRHTHRDARWDRGKESQILSILPESACDEISR